jgi:hypothetical protein
VNCPGCGAAMTSAMVEAGDCGYCGTHLPEAASGRQAAALEKAIEKLAEQPKVVHVTKVELRGPDLNVGGMFDSLTARLTGCFTGCFSMAFTVGITVAILGFSFWQVWVSTRNIPSPVPSPVIEHPKPSPDHAKPGRGKR